MKAELQFWEVNWKIPCKQVNHNFIRTEEMSIGTIGLTYGIYHTQHPRIRQAGFSDKLIAHAKALGDAWAFARLSSRKGFYPEYLADYEGAAFWGRLGAAFGYLALAKGGYAFIGDIASSVSPSCPNGSTRPDFILDNQNQSAILETKGNSLLVPYKKPLPSSVDQKYLIRQVLPYYGGKASLRKVKHITHVYSVSHAWYSRLFLSMHGKVTLFLAHTPGAPWSISAKPRLLSYIGRLHYQKVFSMGLY